LKFAEVKAFQENALVVYLTFSFKMVEVGTVNSILKPNYDVMGILDQTLSPMVTEKIVACTGKSTLQPPTHGCLAVAYLHSESASSVIVI